MMVAKGSLVKIKAKPNLEVPLPAIEIELGELRIKLSDGYCDKQLLPLFRFSSDGWLYRIRDYSKRDDRNNLCRLSSLEEFKEWLYEKAMRVRLSSNTGKAISYTLGQWSKIKRFIESPYLTPDNNAAERAKKPFVVERKIWRWKIYFLGIVIGTKFRNLFSRGCSFDGYSEMPMQF